MEAAARAHLVLVRVDLLSRLSKPSELERVAEVVGHRQWCAGPKVRGALCGLGASGPEERS